MIQVFLGLSATNLLLLGAVFALGLATSYSTMDTVRVAASHQMLGICSGLVCSLTHMAVFTYFMATDKWLEAATNKAGLCPQRFLNPSAARKTRALCFAMLAIGCTIVAMFAGAGADPALRPLWSSKVHLVAAAVAIVINWVCAVGEFRLIRLQSRLIEEAAAAAAAA